MRFVLPVLMLLMGGMPSASAVKLEKLITGTFMGGSRGACGGTDRNYVCDFYVDSGGGCHEVYVGLVSSPLDCYVGHRDEDLPLRTRGLAIRSGGRVVTCATHRPNTRVGDPQTVLSVYSPAVGTTDVDVVITYSGDATIGKGHFTGQRHALTHTLYVEGDFTMLYGCAQPSPLYVRGSYVIVPG